MGTGEDKPKVIRQSEIKKGGKKRERDRGREKMFTQDLQTKIPKHNSKKKKKGQT